MSGVTMHAQALHRAPPRLQCPGCGIIFGRRFASSWDRCPRCEVRCFDANVDEVARSCRCSTRTLSLTGATSHSDECYDCGDTLFSGITFKDMIRNFTTLWRMRRAETVREGRGEPTLP